jgi:hypothetical protein
MPLERALTSFIVGSLLDIPTHTVNMTTLRSAHDLWQSFSMSPYEVCLVRAAKICANMLQDPSTITLANFLVDNEGKRCIVVLDVRFLLLYGN